MFEEKTQQQTTPGGKFGGRSGTFRRMSFQLSKQQAEHFVFPCPRCGAELPADDATCRACGFHPHPSRPLPELSPAPASPHPVDTPVPAEPTAQPMDLHSTPEAQTLASLLEQLAPVRSNTPPPSGIQWHIPTSAYHDELPPSSINPHSPLSPLPEPNSYVFGTNHEAELNVATSAPAHLQAYDMLPFQPIDTAFTNNSLDQGASFAPLPSAPPEEGARLISHQQAPMAFLLDTGERSDPLFSQPAMPDAAINQADESVLDALSFPGSIQASVYKQRMAFPQLPETPQPFTQASLLPHMPETYPPTPASMDLSIADLPTAVIAVPDLEQQPSFSLKAASEATEKWRRSWLERQRAEAAPALDVPRGQAKVLSPLSLRESIMRLRAARSSQRHTPVQDKAK
ncbi:hypothetical protein KSD_52150 [Ktedonobacter sp. SOSP1-85]|uniref:hypothetical protein n=1 Tax=Ktedonobacter sp. SOSP1-85 TaxID=2778367 RepID=UPI0019161443|nr:hypothetical protein [Ktedonobacter sp. SOSP1-85]GHO77444.1 hypothetical protein KSD_52150 [Ktedonobacter sp. SOSP1-85]